MFQQEMFRHLIMQVATTSSEKLLQETQIINKILFEFELDRISYYLVQGKPKTNNQIYLSPREKEIAQLVAQGFSNKSIANQLEISP